MKIFSPYGKEPLTELQETYKIQSFELLFDQLSELLNEQYDLELDDILAVNFGHALTVQFVDDANTYFLKMESSTINATPITLFKLLDHWRNSGLPIPIILTRKDGERHGPLFDNTDYDIEYIMLELGGQKLEVKSTQALDRFIETMIKLHRTGREHTPQVLGGEAAKTSFRGRIQKHLQAFVDVILTFDDVVRPEALAQLKSAAEWVEEKADELDEPLERTHIHGDFRLCHALFDEQNRVTGIVDVDEACYGERLVDLCYAIVSAPSHSDGYWLGWDEQQRLIKQYHTAEPLTEAEIAFLPVAIQFANIEQIMNLLHYWENGDFDDLPKIHANIALLRTIQETDFTHLFA